ncbi:hypothetical protein DFP72DRAFT_900357 [Ephemerocybe angulata]|uniref:Uncharacterized protein n=1 Tax=Ephemerocybe angulata TaxID=980116 RepID=A0A8H6HXF6_9AGAR|nr:hypothetical protein DFP72DRAFT_900357 [Tulosesus angulatus]
MFFQLFTVALAFVATAFAAPLVQRQTALCAGFQLAKCTIIATPTVNEVPNIPAGVSLATEWNGIIGLVFDVPIPNNDSDEFAITCNKNSIVTQQANNRFQIIYEAGAEGKSAAESGKIIISEVEGRTFSGDFSGIDWIVESIKCA